MIRRPIKSKFLNILHRSFVCVCLGTTLVVCSMMCYRSFNYFVYVRPTLKLKEAEEKQKLLSEGKDILMDSAPDLIVKN